MGRSAIEWVRDKEGKVVGSFLFVPIVEPGDGWCKIVRAWMAQMRMTFPEVYGGEVRDGEEEGKG